MIEWLKDWAWLPCVLFWVWMLFSEVRYRRRRSEIDRIWFKFLADNPEINKHWEELMKAKGKDW